MEKIVPHLWYDKEAKEAALFYISLFQKSKLLSTTVLENTPSGNAEIVSFELEGQPFEAISAGPIFKFNPSISLIVACYSIDEVNAKWKALSEGGIELMPLGEYPFSKYYCWVQDKYGLSWQLMLVDDAQKIQKITPNFLFSRNVCGNEAFSLIINCKNQEEIDYFWQRLSAVPEAEECGWVKDKFGVSWQIVPTIMSEMLSSGSREQINRLTEAFLKMKKFDLEILKKAYDGF